MDPIKKAIEISGGVSALAARLNTSPQVVNNWRARKSVPPEYCAAIEEITNGVVTREQLRPEIFKSVA